jgi:signal transduction histidine kinase
VKCKSKFNFNFNLPSYDCCLENKYLPNRAYKPGITSNVNAVDVKSPPKTTSDRLYQAIANLINNAIQYTPAGGKITIRLASVDRTEIVTVRDNGIGIAAEDLPHIFDRFYHVQADRARTTGGTGLGLAIVKAHHGNIQVESQLSVGITFTVTLPKLEKGVTI